jgi:hypothetical protein
MVGGDGPCALPIRRRRPKHLEPPPPHQDYLPLTRHRDSTTMAIQEGVTEIPDSEDEPWTSSPVKAEDDTRETATSELHGASCRAISPHHKKVADTILTTSSDTAQLEASEVAESPKNFHQTDTQSNALSQPVTSSPFISDELVPSNPFHIVPDESQDNGFDAKEASEEASMQPTGHVPEEITSNEQPIATANKQDERNVEEKDLENASTENPPSSEVVVPVSSLAEPEPHSLPDHQIDPDTDSSNSLLDMSNDKFEDCAPAHIEPVADEVGSKNSDMLPPSSLPSLPHLPLPLTGSPSASDFPITSNKEPMRTTHMVPSIPKTSMSPSSVVGRQLGKEESNMQPFGAEEGHTVTKFTSSLIPENKSSHVEHGADSAGVQLPLNMETEADTVESGFSAQPHQNPAPTGTADPRDIIMEDRAEEQSTNVTQENAASSTLPTVNLPAAPAIETENQDPTEAAKLPPTPAKSSQEITLAELNAQRAALVASLAALENVQELVAEDEASDLMCQLSVTEPTDSDIMAAANKIVKKHIKLLHEYNEIKDVGEGLMGLIADSRGVRIIEVQEKFGVDSND